MSKSMSVVWGELRTQLECRWLLASGDVLAQMVQFACSVWIGGRLVWPHASVACVSVR
jgi:hypothetical protein